MFNRPATIVFGFDSGAKRSAKEETERHDTHYECWPCITAT